MNPMQTAARQARIKYSAYVHQVSALGGGAAKSAVSDYILFITVKTAAFR